MSKAATLLSALLIAGAGAPLWADGAVAQGDGSATSNPDLLRGSLPAGCAAGMLCAYVPTAPAQQAAIVGPVDLTVPQPPAEMATPAKAAPAPLIYNHAAPLDHTPPYRTDFSVALRGSYISADGLQRYEAQMIPGFGLAYDSGDTTVDLFGNATIVQPDRGSARLGAAELGLAIGHRVGPTTGLALDGQLTLFQDDADGLEQTSTSVASAPVEIEGASQVSLVQRFGRAQAIATARLSRTDVGNTELMDGTMVSNRDSNVTRFGGGLRLGYEVTPILGVFTQGDIDRDVFDAPSASLGLDQSGVTYGLRLGVDTNWSDVATLEASIGSEWRDFDAGALSGVQSLVYGVAAEFNPNQTTALRASFDTSLAPGTDGAAASVDYTLALEASYRINTWVGLRGTASASFEEPQNGAALTRRYSAGIGTDLAASKHVDLTLDYEYGYRDDPAATPRVRDEHRVSAGATLRY